MKVIYTLNIHMKQSINCQLTNAKNTGLSMIMIRKLLLNPQIIWIIFIKILKNTIQIKKREILIVFDDMIVNVLNNKKPNPIVRELFIMIKLTKKLQNYHYYYQVKLLNMNILQTTFLPSDKTRIIEQAKASYSLLGKA